MTTAKGPNFLNLHSYTQGQQQQQPTPSPQSLHDQIATMHPLHSIQDQFDNFIQQVNKNDDILRHVAADINQIEVNGEGLNEFYPEFIVNMRYEGDEEKNIVMRAQPQMGRALAGLERVNGVLKQEIKGWSIQFAKTTKLSQTLLSENTILRQAICTKNTQLLKLITIITTTQNHQITQMKQQLQILRQENGVLLEHLERMKEQLKQKREDVERLKRVYGEKREEMVGVEMESGVVGEREEHLVKAVVLREEGLEELVKRKRKLQKQKTRLLALKQDYTNDQSTINHQYNQSQQTHHLIQTDLKQRFQSNQQSKHKLIQLIDTQTQKIQKIKQQTRKIQSEIERKQNRLQEFNKINQNRRIKLQQNAGIIANLSKEYQKFVDDEGAIQAQVYVLEGDLESMQHQLAQCDKIQKETEESFKQSLKELEVVQHKQFVEQKNKLARESKEMLKRIFEGRLELSLKQKEIQEWRVKVEMKKQEVKELKAQMKEIRANQVKLLQLKSKHSNQY